MQYDVVHEVFHGAWQHQSGNTVDGHKHEAQRQQPAPWLHERPNVGKTLPSVLAFLFVGRRSWMLPGGHDLKDVLHSALICEWRSYNYIAKTYGKDWLSSIARGFRAGDASPGRSIKIPDAGDKFADGNPQVAPESPLQAGVILRPAEKIAHQLPEHRAAPQELNHARRNRAAQERSAIKTPHNARRELKFGAESSLYPSRVLLRAAFGKRAAE